MPYASVADLPANIRKLSDKQQRQWQQIWNSSYSRCKKNGGSDGSCETSAFKQANGVVLGQHSTFATKTPAEAGKEADLTKQKGAPTPVAPPSETRVGALAQFDLGAPSPLFEAEDESIVYRPGLLFRAGDYPDKKYSMTPEEIRAAADAFSDPLEVDLEHTDTPLSGQLGQVVSVYASDDGAELHGIVAMPKWLDALLPHRRVSATWDRATKTLVGLALTNNPRVSDAALMAAFSVDQAVRDEEFRKELLAQFAPKRHDTPQGQGLLQSIHDITARRGAVCDAKNTPPKAEMASSHEQKAVQAIHDMATEHGATCHANSGGYRSVESPGIRDSNVPSYFSQPAASGTTTQPKEGRKMSRWDSLMAYVRGLADAEGVEGAPGTEGAPPAAGTVAASATPPAQGAAGLPAPVLQPAAAQGGATFSNDRTAQLEAELNRLRAERITEKAAAFADTQIRAGKAFPAEQAQIVVQYEQAARDDLVLGPAKFSVDGKDVERTRVETLEALFATRPANLLTTEKLGPALMGLMNQKETEGFAAAKEDRPLDDAELRTAIGMTPTGRSLLAQRDMRSAGASRN